MNNFDNKINEILQEIELLNKEKQNKYGLIKENNNTDNNDTSNNDTSNNDTSNNDTSNNDTNNKQEILVNNECNKDKCRPLMELQFREYQIKKSKKTDNINNDDNIIDNITDFLDKELENIYNRPWNKLEFSLKNNRIQLFVNDLKKEYNLLEHDIENINILLKEKLNNGNLNKKTDVEYDLNEGKIVNIKNFIIEINDKNEVIYHFAEISKKKKKETNVNKNTEINKIKKLQSSNNKRIQEEYLSQKKMLGIEE